MDPIGEVVSRAGAEETTLHATIDPEAVATWRQEFPALRDIVEV